MTRQNPSACVLPLEASGDLTALLRQLGSGWALVAFEAAAAAARAGLGQSRDGLAARMRDYQSEVLERFELPAIYRAFRHATRGEWRELVALDQNLAGQMPPALLPASERVGRAQLRRLRPLQDERVVQRYWQAVQAGQARAWHPLVFGVTLAVFSVPVYQGMAAYERRSLEAFLDAATRPLALAEADWRPLLDQLPSVVSRFAASLTPASTRS